MPVAVCVQDSVSLFGKPGFRVLFRIELDKLKTAGSHIGKKGDEVCLSHFMFCCDVIFPIHNLCDKGVFFIRDFGFQYRQGDAAAAHNAFPHGVYYISAYRADIEL